MLCVILSDGMGTGSEAAKESAEIVGILEKFLRSGADPAVAMKLLNSVMLLRGGDDSWGYATVDLMCVDLFSGETCFYKYGAAPSYVMNSGRIRRIKGETLAAGLNLGDGEAPDLVRMRLRPGSTAVIASDGVIVDEDDGWLKTLLQKSGEDMKSLAKAISSGSLRGARGNSGVILSQLFRGFTKVIAEYDEIDVQVLSDAFEKAVETAYKAVMKPKEGTILTVAKGMGVRAVELSEEETTDLLAFCEEVIKEGDHVLSMTPDMLPVLKQAGVVDSGGQGLMQVMKGALDSLQGKEIDYSIETPEKQPAAETGSASYNIEAQAAQEIKFAYCTQFLIMLEKPISTRQETEFKEYLESIGDSIVVVADDEIVKVHVHTNDPGLAMQRLMEKGYGFGAEGDWKSAALYRTVWVMNQGLPKGCSFLEDYTLNFDGAQSSILQSHMLEVCPLIAANRPRLEVHFLGIGIRKSQTARLVFTSKVGTGCTATVVDLGNRFRLIVNDVECIEPKPLPKLPVASALWIPMPDFEVGAGAWILAGGTHHSCFSYDLTAEYWEDYAEIAGIEMVHINKDTTISCFKKELRMNEVYYMLNKALC